MKTLEAWLDDLAAATPAPGGGSAAALAGALAGALVAMVARISATDGILAREADALRAGLTRLVEDDATAYKQVMAAGRLPKDHPGRQQTRDEALLKAAVPQLELARRANRLVALAREAAKTSTTNARPDATVAEHLARAALLSAVENVRANVAALSTPERGADLLSEAERLAS